MGAGESYSTISIGVVGEKSDRFSNCIVYNFFSLFFGHHDLDFKGGKDKK